MTTPPDRTILTQATHAAANALDSGGVSTVAHVTSRPASGAYPQGITRTDVHLRPHSDAEPVIAALRALPHLVDMWAADDLVVVLHSPVPTPLGPGGRDGLTVLEAVRQSRLIHPDWAAATHIAWLLDDGYPLDGMDPATLEAMITRWLAVDPRTPNHLDAASPDVAAAGRGADTPPLGGASGEPAHTQRPGPDGAPAWTAGPTGPPSDRLAVEGLPPLPPGARVLSADEAVELLATGDHPESPDGSVILDAILIEAIRGGHVLASRLANGQIAFTLAPQDPTT